MWPAHDDAGLKQQVHTALLGLHLTGVPSDGSYGHGTQTVDIVRALAEGNDRYSFTKMVLISNADESVTAANLSEKLTELDTGKIRHFPQTFCISLLNGKNYVPPIFTISGTSYYGSGFLLADIAKRTNGMYFGMHESNWMSIFGIAFSNVSVPVADFSGTFKCDGVILPPETIMPTYRINEQLSSSRFYTFKCKTCEVIEAEISGVSITSDSIYRKNITIETRDMFVGGQSFLSAEHANNTMQKLLQILPLDTQAIVKFSLEHRLMNDFTAFIALEPNDTNFFMENPNDESQYGSTEALPIIQNAVNRLVMKVLKAINTLALLLEIPHPGDVELRIFNLAGRLVYRHSIHNCRQGLVSVDLRNNRLGRGTYLVVMRYIAHGKNQNSARRLIEKFTIE